MHATRIPTSKGVGYHKKTPSKEKLEGNSEDVGNMFAFPKGEDRKDAPLKKQTTNESNQKSNAKESVAKKLMEKMKAPPPMTTRTETNTRFFAPVLHDVGNTSLFDEEDEMNMSMESGFANRFSGLPADPSPIAKVMSPQRKGTITK